jgi:hypothetical protein
VRAMDGAPEAYRDVFTAVPKGPRRAAQAGKRFQLSPSDSSVALPPTAAVLIVTVCSVANRGR